tara:strand:- start:107 stop:844 length:738 start_codon:yes stop_codon:yes gene_type:complete
MDKSNMEKLDLVIELRDLKNSVHLNGFKGVVVDYIFDEDRFIVKLTENKLVKVKPINIFLDNEVKKIEYPSESNTTQESNVFTFGSPGVFNIGSTSNNTSSRKNRSLRRIRPNKKNIIKTECSICMEMMDGKVILDCGHEMCPTCFARHSRENHTCPFCRKEFAPEIKKKEKMPSEVAEALIERNVKDYYFAEVHDELSQIIDHLISKETLDTRYVEDVKASMYSHLNEISNIMYEDIEEWYDDN